MPVLDTMLSRIARWFPLVVPVDVGADRGPDAGAESAARVETEAEIGPEPRPEPGPDSGTAPLDLGPIIAVDGGTDAAPDTTAEVGPDVPITAILGVLKTGVGGGTVTSSPAGVVCGGTCSANFAAGTVVMLTPTANGTSTFTGWSGACDGTGTCTVTVDTAKSVTANFDVLQEGLNIAKAGAGGGLVTSTPAGIDCGSTCLASFAVGTVVTLAATPDALSSFAGWSGACNGSGNTCMVTSNAATSVTATFVKAAGTACAASGECQAGMTCLDSVCCTQSSCPQCQNCGSGGACNIAVVSADDSDRRYLLGHEFLRCHGGVQEEERPDVLRCRRLCVGELHRQPLLHPVLRHLPSLHRRGWHVRCGHER